MTTAAQDIYYGTEVEGGSGGVPNLTLAIYNNGQYKQLNPIPFLSISEAHNRNEAGFLNTESTLTLNGFILTGGCNDILKGCGGGSAPSIWSSYWS